MMSSSNRRRFMKGGAAALAAPYIARLACGAEPSWRTQTEGPYVEVEISTGRVRGGHSRGALAFKGIPYAGPASGRNRFRPPAPVVPWTGVRDAILLGPPALQGPGTTYGEHEPARSEDCLVLNVWTPAVRDGRRRAVMFYCHGGGFTSGSSGHRVQDGARLAATYDVVVVASNHRLGLFGYLYLGELGGDEYAAGNPGMLDIVAALKWVKENIVVFGGDPNNIMAFGESGGGAKTSTLMAMPAAHGLFHKAGIQSGPMMRAGTKETATETARRVLAGLGLKPNEVSKLAEVPAQKLLDMQLAGDDGPLGVASPEYPSRHPHPPTAFRWAADSPGRWGPVVDGITLPQHPFDPVAPAISAAVPLVIGHTHDEAIFFERNHPAFFHADEAAVAAQVRRFVGDETERALATYRRSRPGATPAELAIAIETAAFAGNDTARLADRKSLQSAPVYRYRYDYPSNVPIAGTDWTLRACHASDISIVFCNYDIPDLQGNGPGLAGVSKAMSEYFASFARTGVPSAQGQPTWSRYDTLHRFVLLLNEHCQVMADPDGEERKFWETRLG